MIGRGGRKKQEVNAALFQHFSVKGGRVCLHASPTQSNARSASSDQRQSLPECCAGTPGEQGGTGGGSTSGIGFSLADDARRRVALSRGRLGSKSHLCGKSLQE